jgi:putative Mg2+ transporter-C (MgtC) family protein
VQNLPSLDVWELVLRIVAAGALGGVVGFERELGDQPAGFRTHILVALGACLFTLVGAYGLESFADQDAPIRFDPTRVAAQVVTGIGFLGAGAIIRQGFNVRGLTTAAALWVTAAIGTAVALGYWVGAVATTASTVAALYGLKRLERLLLVRLKRGYYRFVIEVGSELRLAELTTLVESRGASLHTFRITEGERASRRLIASLRLPAGASPDELAQELAETDGVLGVDWSY